MTMRTSLALSLLALLSSVPAQSFYIPTNTPGTGTSNAFPFSTTDMRYQALITAADLGSTPTLITGFGLAATTTGARSFSRVWMRMAHFTGATLSTTFDSNLVAGATTVMDVTKWKWNLTAGVWNDVDLQVPFFYNGTDNLVVEFQVYGGTGTSGNMYRDATNQRVYLGGYTGQTTGTNGGLTAFKMRVITGDASSGTFGSGCVGSTALTPALTFSGTSQLGNTLGVNLANALATTPVALHLGTSSAGPLYPIDLSIIGAAGCTMYHDVLVAIGGLSNASGGATVSLPIPSSPSVVGFTAYFQWVALDLAANAAGITTSNYGRALVGN